jgi:hypothetical protein
MDWYRRYHGTCADPKLKLVARSANVPTPFAIAAWDAVLEHASAHDDRGSVDGMTGELLAVTIDCAEEQGDALLAAFRKRGMINVDDRVSAWEKRQPGDPTAAERMARKRARDKAASQPPPHPNGPETRNERDSVTPERNGVTTRTEKIRTESEETLSPVVVPKPARPRATPPPREAPVGADDGSESALVQRFCHDPRVTERLKPGDPVEGYRRAIGMVGLWRAERAGKGDLAEILRDALAPDIGNPIGQAITEMKRIDQGSRAFERLRRESTADLRFYQDDPIEGSAEVLS